MAILAVYYLTAGPLLDHWVRQIGFSTIASRSQFELVKHL